MIHEKDKELDYLKRNQIRYEKPARERLAMTQVMTINASCIEQIQSFQSGHQALVACCLRERGLF